MRRLIPLVLLPLALTAVPSPASAGGFCRGGAFSDSAATTVEMKNYCFGPIVTRVEPGQTVEFVNRDKEVHGVGGVASTFGHMYEEIQPGDSVSYKFVSSGVYPYVCVFHPGMAGAVVVGDGTFSEKTAIFPGSTGLTTESGNAAAGGPSASDASEETSWLSWGGPLAGAVLVVALGGAISIRRSRRAPELLGS